MVPVKDDRVLPEELVTNLLATGPILGLPAGQLWPGECWIACSGVWTQVNLDDPLPFHRQSASAGDEVRQLRFSTI